KPLLISDHVAQTWFVEGGQVRHAGDLLPVAFHHAALACLVDNIARVQDHLGRQILIENVAQYVVFSQSDMPE
ncbi:multinuclear nonheme iron-dependent oxidase, partial [Campylobacter jejuni]|uniref:multinuclear nonheme iron-dependent oxidase n=2 Tax=Pseudomonadati TaxID=3379134 RepID=UPI001F096E38